MANVSTGFLASPVVRQAKQYLESEARAMAAGGTGDSILLTNNDIKSTPATKYRGFQRRFRKKKAKKSVALRSNDDQKISFENSVRYWPSADDEAVEWRSYYCKSDWMTDDSPNIAPRELEHLAETVIYRYEGATDKFLDQAGMIDTDTRMTYVGELADDMRNGYGSLYFPDGARYDGTFVDNEPTGKGTFHWPDGSMYCGEVKNGYRHGRGKMVNAASGDCYVGQYEHGKRHGFGRMMFGGSVRNFYAGEWRYDKMHGAGVRRFATGNVYKGEFEASEMCGLGTMQWNTKGQMYRGYFAHGVPNGIGVHVTYLNYNKFQTESGGNIDSTCSSPPVNFVANNMYAGFFKNGHRHGPGIMQYANGQRYDGIYYWDVKHGEGFFVDETKTLHGTAINDHFVADRKPENSTLNESLNTTHAEKDGSNAVQPTTAATPRQVRAKSNTHATIAGRLRSASAVASSPAINPEAAHRPPTQFGAPIVIDNDIYSLNLPLVKALLDEIEQQEQESEPKLLAFSVDAKAREYLEVNRTALKNLDLLKHIYAVYARAMTCDDDGTKVHVMCRYQFSLFVKDCFLSSEVPVSILVSNSNTGGTVEVACKRPKSVAELELSASCMQTENEQPTLPHPFAQVSFTNFVDRTCVIAYRTCADVVRAQQQFVDIQPSFSVLAASLKFCMKAMIEPNAGTFRSLMLASADSTKVASFQMLPLHKVLANFYKLHRQYCSSADSVGLLHGIAPLASGAVLVKELLAIMKLLGIVVDASDSTENGAAGAELVINERDFFDAVQSATGNSFAATSDILIGDAANRNKSIKPTKNSKNSANNLYVPLSLTECMETCIALSTSMLRSDLFYLNIFKHVTQRANLMFQPLQEILHGAAPVDHEAVTNLCNKVQDITNRLPNAAAAAGAAAAAAAATASSDDSRKASIIHRPPNIKRESALNSDINPVEAAHWNDEDETFSTSCAGSKSQILHRLDPLYYKNFVGIENEDAVEQLTDGLNMVEVVRRAANIDTQLPFDAADADSVYEEARREMFEKQFGVLTRQVLASKCDDDACKGGQGEFSATNLFRTTGGFESATAQPLNSKQNYQQANMRRNNYQMGASNNSDTNPQALLPNVHLFSKAWLGTFEGDAEQYHASLAALKVDYFFRHILLKRADAYREAEARLAVLRKQDPENYTAPTLAEFAAHFDANARQRQEKQQNSGKVGNAVVKSNNTPAATTTDQPSAAPDRHAVPLPKIGVKLIEASSAPPTNPTADADRLRIITDDGTSDKKLLAADGTVQAEPQKGDEAHTNSAGDINTSSIITAGAAGISIDVTQADGAA